MLLAAIRKKFSSRNCRLRKSFSTVIMLTTSLCRFSICFLHDRQQNGNVKRSEFVEFDGGKSNKCSRYRGIFCRSSVILILRSPHIVSVTLFSASSATNASLFLIMNIHLLGEKTANVNLCLFCRLRQHYKVHTYVISMEFSAVILAKCHSGRERRRTAVFAGYVISSISIYHTSE